jgi:arylsulfatase A-like enzyme
MKRTFYLLLALVLVPGSLPRTGFGGQAEHVVVVVWDGMRPDYVSPQYTPALYELAKRGTFFRQHHSSYITSTEVNGAVLATGMYPQHTGILGNIQYRPDLSWLGTYASESFDAIRRGDLLSDGHYLGAVTVAETLQQAGFPTITAGAKPVVLLHDRAPRKAPPAQKDSVTLFAGETLPRSILHSLEAIPEVGRFPSKPEPPGSGPERILRWTEAGRDKVLSWLNGKPKIPPRARLVDAWTTRALVHGLWKDGVPKYSLLWLSEPDASQHESGVGSENADVGIGQSDQNLRLVIQALKDKGVFEKTDLLIVSDHGFSTVDRGPDLIKSLKKANFVAGKQFDNPEAGDVMVVSLGGSTAFYIFERDEPTIRRLIEFLQSSDFAGVVFSSISAEGTFALSQVRLDAKQGAPDILVSLHWSGDRNDWGATGMVAAIEGKRGRGTHASLSRFDLHNTLIASGPDFKRGFVSEIPSGNVDLAPTILAILGVPQTSPMDGRVLNEAMVGSEVPGLKPKRETLEASRDLGFRLWHQYLTFTRVGSVTYFDEGNGESRLK